MSRVHLLVAAVTLLGASLSAEAQVAAKHTLTLDGARRVIAAAEAQARRHNAGGVIAVVDDGGNLMAVERLDGTFAAGALISIGKARTAALFKRPTKFFEDVIRSGRTPMVALEDFTPLQGGVPIVIDGEIVGAVGVSGAASAQQDEELAIAGAAALTTTASTDGSAGGGAVAFWSSRQVQEAFARGAVLVGPEGGENYMVHASRRVAPGEAEVHTEDTDIIHVLAGSATLVTGGSVEGGRVTAPGELRGDSIAQGETRQIAKGDVIIVPRGTPHWFKAVRGPLHYYVVKVR
jgi:glc operon protein GlcG